MNPWVYLSHLIMKKTHTIKWINKWLSINRQEPPRSLNWRLSVITKQPRYMMCSNSSRTNRSRQRRHGPMMNILCYNGRRRHIVPAKKWFRRIWQVKTGYKLQDSYQVEATSNANTGTSKRSKNLSRKHPGLKRKMTYWSKSLMNMEQNIGIWLHKCLTKTLKNTQRTTLTSQVSPQSSVMANNAGRDGSTFWIPTLRRNHSHWRRTYFCSKKESILATSGPRSSKICQAEPKTM